MMNRMMRTAALVLAALAPVACATEGAVPGVSDLFDDPGESVAAEAAAQAPPLDAAAGSTTKPILDPVSASTPLSSLDPAELQARAESWYRGRRFDEAVALYDRLLALQPSNAHAWLRLGNIHHQRRDWFKALAAYRRVAVRSIAGVDIEPSLRAKAIYNTALIDLELARRGVRALERLGDAAAAAGDPAPLAREIERTQRRLDTFSTSGSVARPITSPKSRAPAPAPAAAPAVGKSEEPPKVDYFRGEPRP